MKCIREFHNSTIKKSIIYILSYQLNMDIIYKKEKKNLPIDVARVVVSQFLSKCCQYVIKKKHKYIII